MRILNCGRCRVCSFSQVHAHLLYLIVILILNRSRHAFSWHIYYRPNSRFVVSDYDWQVQRFVGNMTVSDDFKVIVRTGDSLIVGARNVVYNISLITLKETKRLEWRSSPITVNKCRQRGKTSAECQNYIRVVTVPNPNQLYICGTNAFDPKCRQYLVTPESYLLEINEENGEARCPFDPGHNNTAIHAGGTLYSATYADYSTRDSLIYSGTIRTEQYNSMWLSEPQFVSSYEYGDKVYFFFRETAVEYKNCGKVVYSRVARICKKDRGGNRILGDAFTSFLKAKMHCSIPGDPPFYFDEIQATSELGLGNVSASHHSSNEDIIYGIFTTPQNSVTGSAVCAYRLSDVIKVFQGTYKEQPSAESIWRRVDPQRIPRPHPESCVNDTHKIMAQTLNFRKSHVLMYNPVTEYGGQPILVQTYNLSRYTSIAVDFQYKAANGKYYDILFVGTDDGRVVKAFNKAVGNKVDTVVIEEMRVFKEDEAVVKLQVYRNLFRGEEKLIVMSRSEIKSIPLSRCQLKKYSCRVCVALQDPYCAWDDNNCINSNHGLQSLETGHHELCPDNNDISVLINENMDVYSSTTTKAPCEECQPCTCNGKTSDGIDNKISTLPGGRVDYSKDSAPKQFNLTTFAISVTLAGVVSLVVGIFIGYCASRCSCDCCSDHKHESGYQEKPSHKSDYDCDSRLNHYESYMAASQQKQLNVVLNVKPQDKITQSLGNMNEIDALPKTRKVYV